MDAVKILYQHRRPFPRGAQDIGTWQMVWTAVAVVAVASNAALVSERGAAQLLPIRFLFVAVLLFNSIFGTCFAMVWWFDVSFFQVTGVCTVCIFNVARCLDAVQKKL